MKRRRFLQTSVAALAAIAVGPRAFARNVDKRPRVGLIGSGWYGKTDLYALCQVAQVEVVALADPDSQMLDEAALRVASWQGSSKPPHKYRDYRDMLADHEFDIVLIDTPDHWHALPMIDAVRHGADVYCQKPISMDVVEGQAMLAAARRHERVVQVGMQRRSTPHLVQAIEEVIEQDLLGEIGHVEICCYYHMRDNRKVKTSRPRLTSITTFGQVPPPCGPTTHWCIHGSGDCLRSTAMGSWATWGSICSIWCGGC